MGEGPWPESQRSIRCIKRLRRRLHQHREVFESMIIELNTFAIDLAMHVWVDGHWIALPLTRSSRRIHAAHAGVQAQLDLDDPTSESIGYRIEFTAPFRTRLRLRASLSQEKDLFHLIPGNVHGDNNASHVRPGEFPCLTSSRPAEQNCAPLWQLRADRASHPVSILACQRGAVG